MKKTAFLFPGQGSQSVRMGQDLYQELAEVRAIFEMAEETSRLPVTRLCFEGPLIELTATVNLQPAITAVNLGCLAALQKAGVTPDVTAGHSLGEYSALCASGVLTCEDTLRLVFRRGDLMHRESLKHAGAMHALLGLSITRVQELVDRFQSRGTVSVANHNTENQIVITGDPEAVADVSAQAAAEGAKAIPLKVSGAWHSELIRGAVGDFKTALAAVTFSSPQKPVVHNVTADFAADTEEIREIMARQLCNPVRWYDSMRKLESEGVEVLVEIGPGRVLSGLLKKIMPKGHTAQIYNVNDLKSLERFLAAIA